MKRTSPIRRGKPPKRKAAPKRVNAKRKARNLLRAYGPAERRAWMVAHHCLTCRAAPPSQQSHLRSRAGAGLKGDAEHVVPMCATCHALYPRQSEWVARSSWWTDDRLNAAAAYYDAQWQAHLARGATE